MKPPKRSLRRHHAERKKAWVKKVLRHYFMNPDDPAPRRVGLHARTPKNCSCWMCGNPRHHLNELPVRERRQLAKQRHEEEQYRGRRVSTT